MHPHFLLFQLILPLAIFCGDAGAQGWIACLTQQIGNGNCASQLEEARFFMERNSNWIQKLENNRNNATENLIKCENEIGIGSDDELKPFLDYAIQTAMCANELKKCQNETMKGKPNCANELEEWHIEAKRMKIVAIVFIGGFLVQSVCFLIVSVFLCRRRKLTGVWEIPK